MFESIYFICNYVGGFFFIIFWFFNDKRKGMGFFILILNKKEIGVYLFINLKVLLFYVGYIGIVCEEDIDEC